MRLHIASYTEKSLSLAWERHPAAAAYRVFWADRETERRFFKPLPVTEAAACHFPRVPDRPYRFYVQALDAAGAVLAESDVAVSAVKTVPQPQLERLDRGLVAVG